VVSSKWSVKKKSAEEESLGMSGRLHFYATCGEVVGREKVVFRGAKVDFAFGREKKLLILTGH
jgi:hypothetical protein